MSPPWTFARIDERSERKDGFGYVSDAEGRDILHVGERTLTEAENVAIGNLAAAAPALLGLAKLLERAVEYEIRKDRDEEGKRLKTITLNLTRETIAKAEGRS